MTITELGTSPLESVTIVDNSTTTGPGVGADTNPAIGQISYSATGSASPFTDFSITGVQAFSTRTLGLPNAILTQSGTITRTGANPGAFTLEIVASDTGFTTPPDPVTLTSSVERHVQQLDAGR